MKMYEGVEIKLHIFLIAAIYVSHCFIAQTLQTPSAH
jgi:hypothetical protein